jgi:alpha-N-arabinofuranosidase
MKGADNSMANILAINRSQQKAQINRNIYGHFSEHLGRCVYGGIWVGEDSPIPNTRGIRNDVVEALKKIKAPIIRWPGGCFADEYHWMDGIGPKESRKEMINTHWGGVVENNHFGTHEYFDFCEQVGCEPYVAGNLGSGTVQEMSEWVEYMNFSGKSPMSALRAKNGREKPFGIKCFGVGNENWGCGGRMTAEHYAEEYMRYQTYCRNYGEYELYRVACGPRNDNYHWTKALMSKAGYYMDGLALHYYTRVLDHSMAIGQEDGNIRYLKRPNYQYASATDFELTEWDAVMKSAQFTEELVSKHIAIMDEYDPEKKVALVVDEWGTWFAVEPGTDPGFLYQQNTLRDAVSAGISLNVFNNHADRIRLANLAQTINVLQSVILTEGEKMILTPTYHVFDMYKVHQDAMLLDYTLLSDPYNSGENRLQQISASVSKSDSGKINITLCNIDTEHSAKVSCVFDDLPAGAKIAGTVLTHSQMNAHNTFDAPETLSPAAFTDFTVTGDRIDLNMPSKSVLLVEIG